jgi:hypothetical protein
MEIEVSTSFIRTVFLELSLEHDSWSKFSSLLIGLALYVQLNMILGQSSAVY